MFVTTFSGVELWYDGENPQAYDRVQDFLLFEQNRQRREQTLPAQITVAMVIISVLAALLWLATEIWLIGLVFFAAGLVVTLRTRASLRKMLDVTWNPEHVLAQLLSCEIVDTRNNEAFKLLNEALAKRNPRHISLDDYNPKLVSEVVPGYLQAVAVITPIHHWWPEELPNTHVLAQEAASRLVREAG